MKKIKSTYRDNINDIKFYQFNIKLLLAFNIKLWYLYLIILYCYYIISIYLHMNN